jgi:chemotaxis signal transduction protein
MSSLAVPINEAAQSARDVSGWLVLTIDNLELAIPQCDVKSVELRSILDVAVDGEAEAGWLEQDDKTWPVYGVNNRLNLITKVPHSRRFCILLYVEDKYIGFLCDQVRILPSDDDLDLQAMPECLISGNSPLKWVTLLDKNVVVVVEKNGLPGYLKEMEAKYGTE